MAVKIVRWEASPKQEAFLKANEDEVLYGGAAGGGKSDALLIFNALRRLAIPNSKGIMFRRTYPELERTLISRSKELFPAMGAKYKEDKHRWTFPNGSTTEFGYSERASDINRYQGAEYEDVCWDELTQFEEQQYLYLFSRTRTTKRNVRTLIRAGSNPGNVGHGWVKSRFVDPAPYNSRFVIEDTRNGVTVRLTRRYVPATLDDNPNLNKSDYLVSLSQLPEAEFRALRNGDWDVMSGQYFRCWNRDVHVIKPFIIPQWWQRSRSLDYGLDMTACGWWAVDDRHRCYLYRELAQPDLILSEAAKTIIERSPAEEMYRYTVASPDLWNRRQDTGFAGEEILYKSGLKGLIKADDRRVPGWQAMYEHMMPVEMKQEDGSIKESPHFFVFDTCTYFISTVPTLIRDDIDPNDINRKSTNDHMAESARYFIMSRPPLSLTEEQKKERKDRQERRNSHNIRSNITGV